jgi:fermentation-respiration switch protein FrsA (DUF1100 family)
MTNKKHRIIKIAAIVAGALILLELLLSVGLVFFAIGSFDGMENIPDAKRILSDEIRTRIEQNTAELKAETGKWLAEADITEVSITAADGAVLYADMLDTESHKWAILLHGYKRTRERVYNYGRFYAEKGFGLIMPDLRGHGKSGGPFIGMGWLDRPDIRQWAELIVSRDPEAEIVLHGVSMGGAAVLMASGEELPANVKCVVSDCAYSSVWEQFANVMQSYTGLPEFPLMYTASFFAKLLAGYSYDEASSVTQVTKSPLPIFFIHGSGDTFVKPYMAEKLYAAHPNGELEFVDGAEHGQAMYFDPQSYFDSVFAFIGKYINGEI